MSRTYRVLCLGEAVAPITHMARSEGNESVIMTQEVVTPLGKKKVPVLTGNALRHRLVREPGARWLLHELGLAGKLTLRQLNFLFHGGSLTEGGGRENTARIAAFQHLFPLGRLLGGCLPDQILSGSMLVSFGFLVCEENRATLTHLMGDLANCLPDRMRPAESFVSGYQYTRGDASRTKRDVLGLPGHNGFPTREEYNRAKILKQRSKSLDAETVAQIQAVLDRGAGLFEQANENLMIFAGQSVVRGAKFLHDFVLQHVAEVELGALLWSLTLWQEAGGTIGGQAARGHGRLKTSLIAGGADNQAAIAAYHAHVAATKDRQVEWLMDVFGTAKPEAGGTTPVKRRGGRKSASASEPVTEEGA